MLMGRRELERGRVGRDVTSFISSVWLALMALVCLGRGGLMTQVDWDLRENEKKGPQKNASKGGGAFFFDLMLFSSGHHHLYCLPPTIFLLFFLFYGCLLSTQFAWVLYSCVRVGADAGGRTSRTAIDFSTSGLVTKDGEARCYFRTGIYRTIHFIIAFNEGTPGLAGSVGRVWSLHGGRESMNSERALSLLCVCVYI
jgi:hypothetical protein